MFFEIAAAALEKYFLALTGALEMLISVRSFDENLSRAHILHLLASYWLQDDFSITSG